MAASLASRLAASLPSQQTNVPGAAQTQAPKETIPKSMAHAVDVEAEIALERVQLDALVVSKILKHGREAQPSIASGVLLGIDLQATLEVSNSFPLPSKSSAADDDEGGKSHARYQGQMLRQLSFVGGDGTVVGSYHTVSNGQYYRQSVLDALISQLDKVRHGGIALVHDVTQAARGNASFKALKLSSAYLAARKANRFHAQGLSENQLTQAGIFTELPVVVRNSPLANAFINTLRQSTSSNPSAIQPTFDTLSLPAPSSHTRVLESLIESLDQLKSEENNLAYLSRQIAREKAKADAHVESRREENASRAAQKLPPLPEEDINRLFRIPPEPSRMEYLMLLGQVDAVSKDLEGLSGAEMVKMYAARAGAT